MEPTPRRRPEILAPVGGPAQLRAAVENGADAVYLGLERHNARERAENFTLAGLPALVADLHARGVRAFVTFNTLLYERELPDAEAFVRGIAAAGADAVIVQDLGVARLCAAVCPELPVHASTQMTITDAASAELARSLGVRRAVLARELSTAEIARIAAATPLELEVFVHGALCVSYSGQCFTSASWGGRSANRGECAQACRLPYDLVVDGAPRDLGPVRYLLSPNDLLGVDAVPALLDAGVASFKIEGRLKGPDYVAATTALYRAAVDRALAGRREALLAPDERRVLEQVYSRGGSPGFLAGTDHQAVLEGVYPRHRGQRLGPVVAVEPARNAVVVTLEHDLRVGDGLLLAGGDPEGEEPGGRVAGLEVLAGSGAPVGAPPGALAGRAGEPAERAPAGARARVVFEPRSLDVTRCPPGAVAWRTRDPALTRALEATWSGEVPRRRAPVHLRVAAAPGAPLRAEATDDLGHTVAAATASACEPARGAPLDDGLLREKLGALGAVQFELAGLELALEGDLHVPVRELKQVRRDLVAALEAARRAPPARTLAPPGAVEALLAADALSAADDRLAPDGRLAPEDPHAAGAAVTPGADAPARVVPLCRTAAQLEGALAAGAGEVVLEWMEMVGLRRAVERARAAGATVVVAPPRIQKPGDERVLDACLRLDPDGLLVRSLGALELLAGRAPADFPGGRGPRLHGDFSLNAANALTARHLLARGLDTFVPAYDLALPDLERLLERVDPARAEVVVHQHLPMFHTEYCAYAKLLSPAEGFAGTSFEDCGRPCERHHLALRDRTGLEHPVLVDVGCRNTVFSGQANAVADDLGRIVARGVRRLRVELLREDAAAAEALVRDYGDVLTGRKDGAAVRRRAGAARRLGVLRVDG